MNDTGEISDTITYVQQKSDLLFAMVTLLAGAVRHRVVVSSKEVDACSRRQATVGTQRK